VIENPPPLKLRRAGDYRGPRVGIGRKERENVGAPNIYWHN